MKSGSMWFLVRFWNACRAVFGVLPLLDIQVVISLFGLCLCDYMFMFGLIMHYCPLLSCGIFIFVLLSSVLLWKAQF